MPAERTGLRLVSRLLLPLESRTVFRGLTEAAHVERWLATEADFDAELRPGGRFRFWGSDVPFTPSRHRADQRILRADPPGRLRIRWTWDDVPTEVGFTLHPRASGTLLEAVHVIADLLPHAGPDTPLVVARFWHVALADLRRYLMRGTAVLRPDLTQRRPRPRLEALLDASLGQVRDALGAETREWCPVELVHALRRGIAAPTSESSDSVAFALEDLGPTTRLALQLPESGSSRRRLGDLLAWADALVRLESFVAMPGPAQRVAQLGN